MKTWGLWVALALALGCSGGSGPRPVPGVVGGACLPDGTCNEGGNCFNSVCVLEESDAGFPDAGPQPLEEGAVNQIIGAPIRDLDILVVVDNSGSMRQEQDSLAANFDRFINVLTTTLGTLPDLHLGVVSTDLGAGPYNIAACTGSGDNGVLQNAPSGACETPGPEPFIIDSLEADGSRTTNYNGALADAFSCIAKLGITGCGFEQQLEAMRRALNGSNAQNNGFLRDNAVLAVLMVTDEDDCSAEDVGVFNADAALDNNDSVLGPLASFRCFEFGVVCEPDTPRVEGSRQNCKPRSNSPYMHEVGAYASFLQGLKGAGGRLIFSAIAGVGPITVGSNNGEPEIESACTISTGSAVSAVRISGLADMLGMPAVQNICNNDFSAALTIFGENVSATMSGRCLAGTPVSAECRILDVGNFGTSAEAIVQELPSCASSATGPCSTLTADSPNCPSGSRVEVDIDRRGTAAPANTVVVASCPQ